MRLDVYIFESGQAESRTEAKSFITQGAVAVDGRAVTKPSFDVTDAMTVSVDRSSKKYVSRGGLKLEHALAAFGVSPLGKACIDIGASTGGFTDCLLQNGAAHVTAVDSGSLQLVASLKADKRVTSLENFNARYMSADDFEERFDLAVMDVSFISATYIIPAVREVLKPDGDFVCLVKPQFELGRAALGKGGIVKDDGLRQSALDKVIKFSECHGFYAAGISDSPISGGDGNKEFLVHFKLR